MCLIGALPWVRGTLLFFTQIVGGIVAAAIISGILPGPLSVQTTLGGGTSVVQGLFLEMILTGQLVFTIIMLAAEKHKSTFIAPVGIGLSLFIAELVGVYFTGGSLNPARSFGPAVVTGSFPGYHWSKSTILFSHVENITYSLTSFLHQSTGSAPSSDRSSPPPSINSSKPSNTRRRTRDKTARKCSERSKMPSTIVSTLRKKRDMWIALMQMESLVRHLRISSRGWMVGLLPVWLVMLLRIGVDRGGPLVVGRVIWREGWV